MDFKHKLRYDTFVSEHVEQKGKIMYRITQDKRQVASAKLFVYALAKTLKTKPYEEITVSEVIKESGAGRATFYRLFDTLDDVLEYASEGIFDNLIKGYEPNRKNDFTYLFNRFYESLGSTEAELLFPLSEGHRTAIISRVFLSHTDELKSILTPEITLSSQELDYLVTFFVHSTAAFFLHHDASGRKESPEELLAIYKKCLWTLYRSTEEK